MFRLLRLVWLLLSSLTSFSLLPRVAQKMSLGLVFLIHMSYILELGLLQLLGLFTLRPQATVVQLLLPILPLEDDLFPVVVFLALLLHPGGEQDM